MAPAARSSKATSTISAKIGGLSPSRRIPADGREATPMVVKPEPGADKHTELAATFKADLTDIRNLVTCSICDQLLYEPWTLSCGHTYCYSCLCGWFVPNKRKKTCPECRTSIKQMPAPAFLVKQMVEIFCKRSEIMPSDESVAQHNQKRAEEVADVDNDKSSPEGLFKGTFRITPLVELLYDQADGVLRCPGCHHEHEGGAQCANCGTLFEGHQDDDNSYGFSDMESDIDGDLELDDLEFDVDDHYDGGHFHHFLGGLPHMHHAPVDTGHIHAHRHRHHHYNESLAESSGSDSSGGSEDDDEEDEGSLQDFVVQDDEPNGNRPLTNGRNDRQPITISDDDESEADGPVNPERRPNRRQVTLASSPTAPSYLSITESANGDSTADAELLRDAGWSSLDTEIETDDEEPVRSSYRGHRIIEDGRCPDDQSDTNTMRNEASDDETDASNDDMSETPTYQYNGERYFRDNDTPDSLDFDERSQANFPHSMDRDGDTEMSASPGPSSSGCGGCIHQYGHEVDEAGDSEDEENPMVQEPVSLSTDGHGGIMESLGVANELHDFEEEEDSDTSLQAPPRRRPRQHRAIRVQQTDPRISMMFAEHQHSLSRAQGLQTELSDFDVEHRRVEPFARNRRMPFYRLQPPCRLESSSSQSPTATRVNSSTNRVSRPPRQYQRRYH